MPTGVPIQGCSPSPINADRPESAHTHAGHHSSCPHSNTYTGCGRQCRHTDHQSDSCKDEGIMPEEVPTYKDVAWDWHMSCKHTLSSHCITANILLRNICAVDCCASHPKGTVGEFNLYWDNIDKDLHKVHLNLWSVQLDAHRYISRSTRKRRRLKRRQVQSTDLPVSFLTIGRRPHRKAEFHPKGQAGLLVPSNHCSGTWPHLTLFVCWLCSHTTNPITHSFHFHIQPVKAAAGLG